MGGGETLADMSAKNVFYLGRLLLVYLFSILTYKFPRDIKTFPIFSDTYLQDPFSQNMKFKHYKVNWVNIICSTRSCPKFFLFLF